MITFKKLWDNYPGLNGNPAPCKTKGKKNFTNQCAIRVGVALAACGVDTTQLVPAKRHCWHHPTKDGHVLAAEELGKALIKTTLPGAKKAIQVDPKSFDKDLKGKTGIIFFKDYWLRSGEDFQTRSGDHIDLWNRNRLTDWSTIFRFAFNFIVSTNYEDCREIWFIEVQ